MQGDDGAARWQAFARPVVGAAYTAAVAATSWNSAMAVDDGGTSPALAAPAIAAWIAASVLFGYLLPRAGFVLVVVAIAVPAVVGERMEEFDEELRYVNWLLLAIVNTALVAPGAWLAHRHRRRRRRRRA